MISVGRRTARGQGRKGMGIKDTRLNFLLERGIRSRLPSFRDISTLVGILFWQLRGACRSRISIFLAPAPPYTLVISEIAPPELCILCINAHANARRDIGCGALLSSSPLLIWTRAQSQERKTSSAHHPGPPTGLREGNCLNKVVGPFGDGSKGSWVVICTFDGPVPSSHYCGTLNLSPTPFHYTHTYAERARERERHTHTHTLVTSTLYHLCLSRFVTAPLAGHAFSNALQDACEQSIRYITQHITHTR